eukprot:3458992-Rhodomonas_salina.4
MGTTTPPQSMRRTERCSSRTHACKRVHRMQKISSKAHQIDSGQRTCVLSRSRGAAQDAEIDPGSTRRTQMLHAARCFRGESSNSSVAS